VPKAFSVCICVLGFGLDDNQACEIAAASNTVVREFHARNLRLIEALVKLGRENQICLGIEDYDADLLRLHADLDVFAVPAMDVIKRIVATSTNLEAVRQTRIVRIRSKRSSPDHSWLDFVVPEFRSPEGSVQTINNLCT
jgi:hypothetical protein